jgi:hypothetical protein
MKKNYSINSDEAGRDRTSMSSNDFRSDRGIDSSMSKADRVLGKSANDTSKADRVLGRFGGAGKKKRTVKKRLNKSVKTNRKKKRTVKKRLKDK